jgi:hypothetical protein
MRLVHPNRNPAHLPALAIGGTPVPWGSVPFRLFLMGRYRFIANTKKWLDATTVALPRCYAQTKTFRQG